MKLASLTQDDVFFALAAVVAAVGIVYPWCLIIAFFILLVPWHRQLKGLSSDSAVGNVSTESVSPKEIITACEENVSPESNASDAVGESESDDEGGVSPTPADTAPKKSIRARWGIPTVRIRDSNGNIITINSEEPVPFESEHFKGLLLLMVRTDGELAEYNRYEHHFSGKQRKFEFQFQGQLKTLPKGMLMMGGEIPEKMEMGLVTRALVSMIMKFCMKLVANLRFGFGEEAREDGKYELPHLCFPMYRTMDRVVVTPPGQTPPTLGSELPESDADRNARRSSKTPDLEFQLGYTYSFSFHSMYIDFANWAAANVPGYKAIDLKTFVGNQSVNVVVYEIEKPAPGAKVMHYMCNKRYLFMLNIAHVSAMSREELAEVENVDDDDRLMTTSDVESDNDNRDEHPIDESTETATSQETAQMMLSDSDNLNEGEEVIPVNSSVAVTLLPAPWEAHDESLEMTATPSDVKASFMGMGDIGGFAVRKDFGHPQLFRFLLVHERPKGGYLRRRKRAPDGNVDLAEDDAAVPVLRAGSVVQIQCVQSGRFLTVYRGWWLGWSHDAPLNSKGHFVISSTDGAMRAGAPMPAGKPFMLQSARWTNWAIGSYISGYSEHGGFPLVLYQATPNPTGPIKWRKNGKFLNPLYLCVLADSVKKMRTVGMEVKEQMIRAASPEAMLPRSFSLTAHAFAHNGFGDDNSTPTNSPPKKNHLMHVDDAYFGSYSAPSVIPLSPTSARPSSLEELQSLKAEISGWVELFHRTTSRPQLAYIVTVSVGSNSPDSKTLKRWTTLRTQRDLTSLLNQFPNDTKTVPLEKSPHAGTAQRREDIIAHASAQGRGVNHISLQHQSSADQSVCLMSQKIKSCFAMELEGIGRIPSPPSDNGDEDAPRFVREASLHFRDAIVGEMGFSDDESDLVKGSSADDEDSGFDGGNSGDVNEEVRKQIDTESIERLKYPVREAFFDMLVKPHLLDTWFLKGNPEQMRVAIPTRHSPKLVVVVARALWGTHWREEVATLYPSFLSFYTPMSKKPAWSLPLHDIIGISNVSDDTTPLPTYHTLRLETLGRVHYVAFATNEARHALAAAILEHITESSIETAVPSGVLGDPRDVFVLRSGKWRPVGRLVLNARVFNFDLPQSEPLDSSKYWELSVKLLQTAFGLDSPATPEPIGDNSGEDVARPARVTGEPDSPYPGRERLIAFLDETVRLKRIDLRLLDLESPEALCFFVNVYHALLMHARLVLSPPTQQNWALFFETVSYEIGDDVFSLAELEHCVLRGKLCKPRAMPRNFAQVPPSTDDHYAYALGGTDQRLNFLINCGSVSNPPIVFMVTPDTLYARLNEVSQIAMSHCLKVDSRRRTVVLPKVCDVYRADFGEDAVQALRHCVRYLGREHWEQVSLLLTESRPPTIKFQELRTRSHSKLRLIS